MAMLDRAARWRAGLGIARAANSLQLCTTEACPSYTNRAAMGENGCHSMHGGWVATASLMALTCMGMALLLLPPAPPASAAVSESTTRLLTSSAADMRSSSVKRFRCRRSAAAGSGGGRGRQGRRRYAAVSVFMCWEVCTLQISKLSYGAGAEKFLSNSSEPSAACTCSCMHLLPASVLTLRDSVARDSGTLQPFLPTRSQVNPAHTYPPRPITPVAAGQGRLPCQPIPSLHHSLSMLGQSSLLNPATRLMLWLSSSIEQNTNAIATT